MYERRSEGWCKATQTWLKAHYELMLTPTANHYLYASHMLSCQVDSLSVDANKIIFEKGLTLFLHHFQCIRVFGKDSTLSQFQSNFNETWMQSKEIEWKKYVLKRLNKTFTQFECIDKSIGCK